MPMPWSIASALQYRLHRFKTSTWYRLLFGKLGSGCVIESPVHLHKPEYARLGSHVRIGPYCRIEIHDNYGRPTRPSLTIGDHVGIEHAVHLYCAESVTIGDHALIASGCMITDNNHGTDPRAGSYAVQPLDSKPTRIGRNTWLGENVAVLAGAEIGDYSIIGSNSVVTGTIPAYCMAAGAPARVIRRFDHETGRWISV